VPHSGGVVGREAFIMSKTKKGLSICLLCYVLWGILPVYWNLLGGLNPLFILCCRIIFAFVFTVCVLAISGRLKALVATLKNKDAMRYLAPAAVLITFNWGLYIWAVNTGRILDTSLGYYMNPLIAYLLGILVFREKSTKLQLAAVALAFTGVLISLIAYGSFPFISISLSLSFATYGVFKKKAGADPVAGIAVESLVITPFALAFAIIFMRESISTVSAVNMLLLIGGGAATAMPLVLYARAVNDIPFIIVGFFQYLSPTLTLTYGLIMGEKPSASQIVSFIFIGLGLIVFSIALVRNARYYDNSAQQESVRVK